MSVKFQRRVEDFVCEHCEEKVSGDGYTNHCPHCLWSKHVDLHPGDRAAACGGMMQPVNVEGRAGQYRLRHRCQKCGYEKYNKVVEGDDFEALLALATRRVLEA